MAKPKQSDLLIKHNFNSIQDRALRKSGAPDSAFLKYNRHFDLEDCTTPIEASLPGVSFRRVSVNKQLDAFERIRDKPLRSAYVYCISSYPSDVRAKQVALYLMNRAVRQYFSRKNTAAAPESALRKQSPHWHQVFGGFDSGTLDKSNYNPSLLVLSNVLDNSTPSKIEKLRDIIERFSSIPRIIVTASVDPLTFMLGQLHCSTEGGVLYLGPNDMDKRKTL